MRKVSNKIILGVCCSTLLAWSAQTMASEGFIVRGIKVTGLQRVSTGTVLNYIIKYIKSAEIIQQIIDSLT